MRQVMHAAKAAMKTIMEINEASFPWYAAMVTVIMIFRLFSEDMMTKIGISAAMILGFFATSAALKIIGAARRGMGGRKREKAEPAEAERGTRGSGAAKAAWIAAGAGAGAFASRASTVKIIAMMGSELSEAGAWIVLAGAALCAMAETMEMRK